MSKLNNPQFGVNAYRQLQRGIRTNATTGSNQTLTIPTGNLGSISCAFSEPSDGPAITPKILYFLVQNDPSSFGEVIVDFDTSDTPTLKTTGIKLLPGGAMEIPVVGQVVFHNISGGDVTINIMRIAGYERHYSGR